MAKINRSVDHGKLQDDMELASKNLKTSITLLNKAKEQHAKADAAYGVAQKTLNAGVEQLTASTKV